jgi:glycosyltransferase involved in cell wall biosynthesis
MTTYNHEAYIAQAVQSVLAQQVSFPIELVIGEDFSTDRTREIVQNLARQHPDRIHLRLSEKNMGGQGNFLATFAECRGQYVARLEGDDYWTCADKLQRQVDKLDAHPEWAICFHPCACSYEGGMHGIPVYPVNWTKPVATVDDLFWCNFLPTSSVVFRNRLVSAFPDWFRDLRIGDWPLNILHAVHGDIGFLPGAMSVYRVHPGGVWSGASEAERIVSIFELLSAIDHHFAGKYSRPINEYRSVTVRYLVSQLDAATSRVSNVANQLGSANAQIEAETLARAHTQAQADAMVAAHVRAQELESARAARLERLLNAAQTERQWLAGEYNQLQNRYATLEENTLRLQEFYKTWTKSILYRVEREIRRPIGRLRQYLQNRMSRKDGPPSSEDPKISKAA